MSYPVLHPTLSPTNEFLAVVCVRSETKKHLCPKVTGALCAADDQL